MKALTIPFLHTALSVLATASTVAGIPATVVSPTTRSIIDVAQTIVFNVTTSVEIQITATGGCSASPSSVPANVCENVVLNVPMNPDREQRTLTVHFGPSATATITQGAGPETVVCSPSSFGNLSWQSTALPLTLTANGPVTLTGGASWVTLSVNQSANSSPFTSSTIAPNSVNYILNVAQNNSPLRRSTVYSFANATGSLSVSQLGQPLTTSLSGENVTELTTSKYDLTCPCSAAIYTVVVHTNGSIPFTPSLPSWITASIIPPIMTPNEIPSTLTNGSEIELVFHSYNGVFPRMVDLTIGEATLEITQNENPVLTFVPASGSETRKTYPTMELIEIPWIMAFSSKVEAMDTADVQYWANNIGKDETDSEQFILGQQIFLEQADLQAAAYAPYVNAGVTILVDTGYAVLCETTAEGDPAGPPACIALATSLTGTAANDFINGAYKANYLNQSQYKAAMAGSAVVFTIVDLGTGSAPESITDWASVGGTIADGGAQLYIYTIKNSTPANTTQLTIDDGSQIASLLNTIQQQN